MKRQFRRVFSLMMAAMIVLSTVVLSPMVVLAETYPEQESVDPALSAAALAVTGYPTPDAMYIVSALNGKVLQSPGLQANGTAAGDTKVYATADAPTGMVPVASSFQFQYSGRAQNKTSAIRILSAVKSATVAALQSSGGNASNSSLNFGATSNGSATPATDAAMDSGASSVFLVRPNGDGTVSIIVCMGGGITYTGIDAEDGNIWKTTTVGDASERPPTDAEKFIVVPAGTLLAPTNLEATQQRPAGVSLRWGGGVDAAGVYTYNAGYVVYRDGLALNSEVTPVVAKDDSGYFTYLDTAAMPGQTYTYTVRALGAAGSSPDSNAVTAVLPAAAGPSVNTAGVYYTPLVAGGAVIETYFGYGADAAAGVAAVKVGDAVLDAGQFAVDTAAGTVTILPSALNSLADGAYDIEIAFNDGANTIGASQITVAALPTVGSAWFLISRDNGKLVKLPNADPSGYPLTASGADPLNTAAQWRLDVNRSNTAAYISCVGLTNLGNNAMLTVEGGSEAGAVDAARARTLPTTTFDGYDYEDLQYALAGDGYVTINRYGRGTVVRYLTLSGSSVYTTTVKADASQFLIVPPAVPANAATITRTLSATSALISWTLPTRTFYTTVQLSVAHRGETSLIDVTDRVIAGANNYTYQGLVDGDAYSFQLLLTNARGSRPSNTLSLSGGDVDPPLAPLNLSYQLNADGTGTLTWSPNTDDADITGYKIRCADGAYASVWNDIPVTLPRGTNTYTVPAGVSGNKWGYYQVFAYNKGGETPAAKAVGRESAVFGANTYIFNAAADDITKVNGAIGGATGAGEFATNRYALFFKPGTYDSTISIGFYDHVAGLGYLPTDVVVNKVEKVTPANATTTFWRATENLTMSAAGVIQYAVSQAAPIRRVNLPNASEFRFDGAANESNSNSAWASGGYLSDSYIPNGRVGSFTQQQWYFRNNDATSYFFNARCHSTFYQGVTGDMTDVNSHEKTVIENTPIIAEKPYLYFKDDEYYVFVPGLRYDAVGRSWTDTSPGVGTSVPFEDNFFVARANETTVTQINDAIASGKDIFFTPGIYNYDQAIIVNRPNTIMLGYGLVTIMPTAGNNVINVGDVAGVRLAGLMLEAGGGFNPDTNYNGSYALLQVGENGTDFDAGDNPVILQDVFARIGGPSGSSAPKVDNAFVINTAHTIIDHTWLWRADHGSNQGWYVNEVDNGLVVSGDYVTSYGAMSEHFNKYDVLWKGDYGRLYFLQNELVYRPVSQANYQGPEEDKRGENCTTNGWAALRVADDVLYFDGYGLGCYDVYQVSNTSISLANAVVTPLYGHINIVHFVELYLSMQAGGGTGSGFEHMVNGIGKGAQVGDSSFTSGASFLLPPNPYDNGNPNEWHSLPADDGKIIYFEPVEVTTPINTAPVLPVTARVRYGSGEWGTVSVSWPEIDPADYDKAGEYHKYTGTIQGGQIQDGSLGPATSAALTLKVEGDAIHITAVPTLVQGYNYRLPVSVSIDGLLDSVSNPNPSKNVDYYLYNADTRATLGSKTNFDPSNDPQFPITYTNQQFNQSADSIPRMYILVRWYGDTEYRASYAIDVVPGDLWNIDAEKADGRLTLTFKQPLGSIGAVAVAGAAYAASISEADPAKVIVQGVVPKTGDLIVVNQVKFRDVFQSYDFKFTKVY
ncbi:MAG: Ig-like domain-containing protein [Oscillospiraceae bacterium]|jgi:hypothetical protein|nr:Ig-like domain-containing protein [Oscillospiraceae bacterium]